MGRRVSGGGTDVAPFDEETVPDDRGVSEFGFGGSKEGRGRDVSTEVREGKPSLRRRGRR